MMVVAKKKPVQKKRTVTVKTKASTKRKVSTASHTTGSITESMQFRLMIICFTLLSILFTTIAFWRYG